MSAPRVELLWWAGCPSWEQAVELTRAAMSTAGLDPEALEVREIGDLADAERERFPGSPTIRVDGRDVDDPGREPVGLTCRLYRLADGRPSALPEPALIEAALEAALSTEGDRDE